MEKVSIGRRIAINNQIVKKKIKSLNKDQIVFLAVMAATSAAGSAYTSHRVNQ